MERMDRTAIKVYPPGSEKEQEKADKKYWFSKTVDRVISS